MFLKRMGLLLVALACMASAPALAATNNFDMMLVAGSMAVRHAVPQVHASEALLDYVQALIARSRQQPGVRVGLSPRAGLALLRAARAHALLLGRDHVLPEDVQALFPAVAEHRLVAEADASAAGLAKAILHAVAVD